MRREFGFDQDTELAIRYTEVEGRISICTGRIYYYTQAYNGLVETGFLAKLSNKKNLLKARSHFENSGGQNRFLNSQLRGGLNLIFQVGRTYLCPTKAISIFYCHKVSLSILE